VREARRDAATRPPSTNADGRSVTRCDGDCLLLPDQNDQPFATCHASVEKVPLQPGVMLGQDRGDHGWVFRTLAFVDGRSIGWHRHVEFTKSVSDGPRAAGKAAEYQSRVDGGTGLMRIVLARCCKAG
jgi:hypothetical protein